MVPTLENDIALLGERIFFLFFGWFNGKTSLTNTHKHTQTHTTTTTTTTKTTTTQVKQQQLEGQGDNLLLPSRYLLEKGVVVDWKEFVVVGFFVDERGVEKGFESYFKLIFDFCFLIFVFCFCFCLINHKV